jgi:hypothetical protein
MAGNQTPEWGAGCRVVLGSDMIYFLTVGHLHRPAVIGTRALYSRTILGIRFSALRTPHYRYALKDVVRGSSVLIPWAASLSAARAFRGYDILLFL